MIPCNSIVIVYISQSNICVIVLMHYQLITATDGFYQTIGTTYGMVHD